MPMMHPEDEANSDAPLVPDIRPRNRPQTTDRPTGTTRPEPRGRRTTRRDHEPLQRELAAIRARLSNIEARLSEGRSR